ncbi:MAG: RNA polymerase factor sigma-54 [Bacteroidetes bacterium]|nr:RNA polymerase factor sigma-54 [Bacteroidota bacterium]
MLNQNLSQKLLQKLSPQQIQLMKLLQIPTAQLDQRIKEEIEVNPALEVATEDEEEFAQVEESDAGPTEDIQEPNDEFEPEVTEPEINKDDDLDMTEFYDESDEGVAEYKTKDPNEFADPDDEGKTIPVAVSSTFHEYLEEQVGMLPISDREKSITMHLIGSIDDDGYLRRDLDAIIDDLAFSQNIMTDEKELAYLLSLIQSFEPAGVGARTLEECLLLQLKRKDDPTMHTDNAIRIIEKQFDAFAKKHYEKLEKSLGLDAHDLKMAVSEIISLNPKPGSSFSGGLGAEQFIIPDYIITNNNGELVLTLNSANAPELRISNTFRDMISDYKRAKIKSKSQKEAIMFIKQKIESAKWFIDAIQQRQNTMIVTMQTIMELQYDYLISGDETKLRPMILKDVAEKTGLDISTISRVANSKYVQTEFGTLLLKSFFSESLTNDEGEEVSTREVKKILSDLIGMEDKNDPLSDQKLTEYLMEKGYNIARRTVAKYREQLNLPVARLRKEL